MAKTHFSLWIQRITCIIIFEHQRAQKARQMRNENNNQQHQSCQLLHYTVKLFSYLYISIVTLAPDAKNAHYAIITLSSLAVQSTPLTLDMLVLAKLFFFFKLMGKFNAERRIGNSLVSLFAIISRQQTSRLQRILLRHSFEIFKSSVITIFVITISQVNRMITPIFLYFFFFSKKKTFKMDRRQMMNTPPE